MEKKSATQQIDTFHLMLYSTKANAIDNENVSINQMYTYVLTFIEPVRLIEIQIDWFT